MTHRSSHLFLLAAGLALLVAPRAIAQEPAGPQTAAPAPVRPVLKPAYAPQAPANKFITLPSGTRVAVVLENGISTRSAKPGDSVYLRTSFPVTVNNQIIIPVGSYVRGEILEAQRAGHIKGKAELRLRLDTLIFPNGYTVSLNAAPRSADSGGNETMDSEGKISGPSGKGEDLPTVVRTTAETT